MHKFIGEDDCSTCMYCGVSICDDADALGFLPMNCPGPVIDRTHHFISSCTVEDMIIVSAIECAYCGATYTDNTIPDDNWECK